MIDMNPKLKKGDKAILKKSVNSLSSKEGQIFTVVTARNGGAYTVIFDGNKNKYNVYDCGAKDTFVLLTREAQAAALKEELKGLKKQMKELKAEIERLEAYSSDEEEAADKIAKILENPSKENIQKVLETMRKSDYL